MKKSKGKSKKPVPMKERILQLVCSRSETSIKLVVARLGKYISDARAAVYGRRELRSNNSMIRRGKRAGEVRDSVPLPHLLARGRAGYIAGVMGEMYREGKIVRLRRGVYGPPPPKLHQPVAV